MELYCLIGKVGAPDVCGKDYWVKLKECDVHGLPFVWPGAVEPVSSQNRPVANATRRIGVQLECINCVHGIIEEEGLPIVVIEKVPPGQEVCPCSLRNFDVVVRLGY